MKDVSNYPIERIKIDLQLLISQLGHNSSEFSYLPFLKKNKLIKINVDNLSTFDVFLKLHNEIKNVPNIISTRIIRLLKSRPIDDLFTSAICFLNKINFYGDDYYWNPNVKVTNVFSLIKIIIPNFIDKYREYLIGGNIISENILLFIDSKFPKKTEQFKGILADYLRFGVFKQDFIKNITGLIGKSENSEHKLITLPHWVDEYEEYFNNKEIYSFNEHAEIALVPEISFVEIEIDGKELKIPFNIYLQLIDSKKEAFEYIDSLYKSTYL